MIWFVLYCLVINILNSMFHQYVRVNQKVHHGLAVIIDFITFAGLLVMIQTNCLYVDNLIDAVFYLIIPFTLRLIVRDVIMGIGTTSWMDVHIRGFYRLSLYILLLFSCFVIIHSYYQTY